MSSKLSNPMWFATPEFLVIVFPGLDPVHIRTSSPNYPKVFQALTVQGDYDEVLRLVTPEKQVSEMTEGSLVMTQRGSLHTDDKEVDPIVRDYIPEFLEQGWSLQPLVLLAQRIHQVKNDFVRDQMVRFLRSGKLQITNDGCFVAYKIVTRKEGKLVDIYSGTFSNDKGCSPRMDPADTDDNPHATCSKGLHVGTWGYMSSGFGSGATKEIIAVKVNPADVISVPYEYQSQKMRTCGYRVIAESVKTEEDYKAARRKASSSAYILESMSGSALITWAAEHLQMPILISPKSKQRILLKIREALAQQVTVAFEYLLDGTTEVYL